MRPMYQKCKPVRDEEARVLWRAEQGSKCQCCLKAPDFRGLAVHHIVRFRRSDEPCNLLLLCGDCHEACHDGSGEKLSIGMMLTVKVLTDPTEYDRPRLEELYGSPMELEPMPDWLLLKRMRRGK